MLVQTVVEKYAYHLNAAIEERRQAGAAEPNILIKHRARSDEKKLKIIMPDKMNKKWSADWARRFVALKAGEYDEQAAAIVQSNLAFEPRWKAMRSLAPTFEEARKAWWKLQVKARTSLDEAAERYEIARAPLQAAAEAKEGVARATMAALEKPAKQAQDEVDFAKELMDMTEVKWHRADVMEKNDTHRRPPRARVYQPTTFIQVGLPRHSQATFAAKLEEGKAVAARLDRPLEADSDHEPETSSASDSDSADAASLPTADDTDETVRLKLRRAVHRSELRVRAADVRTAVRGETEDKKGYVFYPLRPGKRNAQGHQMGSLHSDYRLPQLARDPLSLGNYCAGGLLHVDWDPRRQPGTLLSFFCFLVESCTLVIAHMPYLCVVRGRVGRWNLQNPGRRPRPRSSSRNR
jgi:hypothetical protein